MKKVIFIWILLIGFGNLTSGAVKIKPKNENAYLIQKQYSKEETDAANLWNRSRPLNNLKDENKIYPGNLLIFEWPFHGDRHMSIIYPGDYPLKMAKQLVSPEKDTARSHWISNNPFQKVVPIMPVIKTFNTEKFLLWILIFFLVSAFFATILYVSLSEEKIKKLKESLNEISKKDREKLDELLEELQKTKNKLPIIAPEIADEEWLRNNNPVESQPTFSDYEYGILSQATIERVFGKKPDLIVSAKVSTDPKAVSMEFSHERKANTGLNNVAVWLGWNWNTEKNAWVEVGKIASMCSNGFELNPDRVEKMDPLFTSVELVKKDSILYFSGIMKLSLKIQTILNWFQS